MAIFFGVVAISVAIGLFVTRQQANASKDMVYLNELIEQRHFAKAIPEAVQRFGLRSEACLAIELASINSADEGGESIVAQTNFDQVVRLDPERDAFYDAGHLVLTLAHEIEHCEQHQRLYAEVIAENSDLTELREQFPQLRDLSAAVDRAREGDAVLELERRLANPLAIYARRLTVLFEMGAIVKALELPRVASENAENGNFQSRYLKVIWQRWLQQRGFGTSESVDTVCGFDLQLPAKIQKEYQAVCHKAAARLR